MVSRSYILRKPPPRSSVMVFVNQTILPALIDTAAIAEQQLERIAVRARRAPLTSVGVACGFGWLAAQVVLTPRGRR